MAATSYTLYFSDPTNTATIVVPSMVTGSGKNNYDTSLDLIGPGYPNYGLPIDQNFVKLLENFASPHPPENAIEGQLWYDTSNPDKKVLRINNGSGTSTRWPNATGIYQQPNDPSIEYSRSVSPGDLWIDTSSSQLKLRVGDSWSVVGPGASTGLDKTGSEAAFIQSNTGTVFPVILNWANGKVVEIISYNDFVPRSVIDGFSVIRPGTNITNKVLAKYNGLADRASSIEVAPNILIRSYEILKNRAASQTHTGTFIVQDATGLMVKNSFYPNEMIRIYNTSGLGHINLVTPSKPLKIGVGDTLFNPFNPFIQLDPRYGNIGVNTSTFSNAPTFNVNGSGAFSNTLTIQSTAISLNTSTGALIVKGGIGMGGNLNVQGYLNVRGTSTFVGTLLIGSPTGQGSLLTPAANDRYDLGTTSTAFRRIFASQIGSTGTNVDIYGTVYGTTTALEVARNFRIEGIVTTTVSSSFDGNADVIFTTTIHRSLIADQPTTSTTTATQTLLVLNTSTTSDIEKISKADFLVDVYPSLLPVGMIIINPTSTAEPTGYLSCNGQAVSQVTYSALFSRIGTIYGIGVPGTFRVPDLRYSTVYASSGTVTKQLAASATALDSAIYMTDLSGITGGLIIDGQYALQPRTSVAGTSGTNWILLSTPLLGGMGSGTELRFSTATYFPYIIKT